MSDFRSVPVDTGKRRRKSSCDPEGSRGPTGSCDPTGICDPRLHQEQGAGNTWGRCSWRGCTTHTSCCPVLGQHHLTSPSISCLAQLPFSASNAELQDVPKSTPRKYYEKPLRTGLS